jgi:hypothetical protein
VAYRKHQFNQPSYFVLGSRSYNSGISGMSAAPSTENFLSVV